jgi:ribosomal protein L10
MLNVIIGGGMIEIFANDDIGSFKQIFSEFMKTSAFYDLPPEMQNYIRDVLVSIATAGAPFEDYMAAMNNAKVFPRVTAMGADRGQVAGSAMAPNSANSQAQVRSEQAAQMSRTGSVAAAEHQLTNRSEAQIGSRRSGPG